MEQSQIVETTEECPYCGNSLLVTTSASQEADKNESQESWYALGNDVAHCPNCGLVGRITVTTEGSVYFSFDEEAKSSIAAYDKAANMEGA